MTSPNRPAQGRPGSLVSRPALAALVIATAVILTYANSLGGAFLFDDLPSIPDNPTIRHLGDLRTVLHPPHGEGVTVEGRPLLNLSFALNYAAAGNAVQAYHATNLAIHLGATLLLFGLVRRLLARRAGPVGDDANAIAAVAALLWGLHPLQTESVSYLVQRAESLMGLCFLGSAYALVRASEESASRLWGVLTVALAFLAVATKEVAVTLPVVLLLLDRTFLAGSFCEAWRRRRALHLAVAASWILLAVLVVGAGDRGGTIGARAGVTPWQYALCQAWAVFHYLRLSLWPSPLVMDYGTSFLTLGQAFPWAVLLLILLAATVYLTIKRPAWGFLGAWFFVILAPTTSFVGGTRQMLAEHRMYLSLAALAVAAAVLLYRFLGRGGLGIGVAVALAFGVATSARNPVYHDSFSVYQDTVRQRPGNAWAHYNFGKVLDESGHPAEAKAQYEASIALDPNYAQARYNLGNSLEELGQHNDAAIQFAEAIRIRPRYAKAEYNLGNALVGAGDLASAIEHFRHAVAIQPDFSEAQDNLGTALLQTGRPLDAIEAYRAALLIDPNLTEAHFNLGGAYLFATQYRNAAEEYNWVIARDPDLPEAHYRLGNTLEQQGRVKDAIEQYRIALRLRPGDANVQADLDRALQSR